MKTVKELIAAVTIMEGKKVEVSKANVNEVMNCLAKIIANDPEAEKVFAKYVKSKKVKTDAK